MKKLLSLLTIVFGILVLMMLPAGGMKAEAKGNNIVGSITWDDLKNGNHIGDYIVQGTEITNCNGKYLLRVYELPGDNGRSSSPFNDTCYYNWLTECFISVKERFYQNREVIAFEVEEFGEIDGYNYLKLKRVFAPEAAVTDDTAKSACDHDYEWTTVNEATEDCDGLEECRCTKCGAVCASRKIPKLSDNFNYVVEKETEKFVQAKSGQTIKIDLKDWNSIPKSFFEELAKRRDITTTIRFVYNHKVYEFTIERGQTVDTACDYYGPEKLIQLYGAKEVVTK